MVLDREENRDSIQLSNESAGYLVCSGCEGFYELQEDETPEDFDKCECGSPLVYYKTREKFENRLTSSADLKSTEKSVFEEEISKNNSEKTKKVNKNLNMETTPDSDFKTTSYTGTLASTDKSVLSNKLVASTDKAAVNRLYPQTNISDDVLTRRKQEGKDLWGNLDDLNSKNNHQPQQAKDDHNLEIDRLMVLVDHKRTFKEESRFNSKSGPGKNPIIIAGLAIVLVVIVLALVMVLGLF